MEQKLRVFVSSSIMEFFHERGVVKDAVDSIPITRSWVFEYSSASTDSLEESYLKQVRECDIFILILGQHLTKPVYNEWQIATAASKPRLVFLKQCVYSQQMREFIDTIDVKWARFGSSDELRQKVQEAIADELIKSYHQYRLQPQDSDALNELRERLNRNTIRLKIDNRSGGNYFEGGSTTIVGDVVSDGQNKIIYKTSK